MHPKARKGARARRESHRCKSAPSPSAPKQRRPRKASKAREWPHNPAPRALGASPRRRRTGFAARQRGARPPARRRAPPRPPPAAGQSRPNEAGLVTSGANDSHRGTKHQRRGTKADKPNTPRQHAEQAARDTAAATARRRSTGSRRGQARGRARGPTPLGVECRVRPAAGMPARAGSRAPHCPRPACAPGPRTCAAARPQRPW